MLSMDRGPDTGRGLGAPACHLSLTGLGCPRDRDMRPMMRPDHTRGQTSRVSRTRVKQDPVQHYIHLHALDPNQRRIHDLGLLVGLKLEMLSLSIVNRQSRSHLEWIGLKSTGKIIISPTEASGLSF